MLAVITSSFLLLRCIVFLLPYLSLTITIGFIFPHSMVGIHPGFPLPSADVSHLIKPGHGIFLLFFGVLAPTIPNSLFEFTDLRSAPQMSWDNVYRLVQRIPRGKVLTYGGLARALGLPGGARTAGRAMAATPSGKGIPWHRVIGDRGKILIRGPHALLQKKLLESEGVSVVAFRVDLKGRLWQPSRIQGVKRAAPRTKRRK